MGGNRYDGSLLGVGRDAWWEELRREVQASTRQLGYTAVVGYVETTTICNNLCLLSATGRLLGRAVPPPCTSSHMRGPNVLSGTVANVNTDLTQGTACVTSTSKLAVPANGSRRRRRSTSDIPMSAPVDFAPVHLTVLPNCLHALL